MADSLLARVLLPLDGSERSACIIDQAAALLARAGEVVLVRAADAGLPANIDNPVTGQAVHPDTDALAARLAAELEPLAARIREAHGVTARVRVELSGESVTERICAAARAENATLLALTTHGRTGLSRLVFGSVAESLLRCAPAPLLICPSFVRAEDGTLHPASHQALEIGRILVPVDGSEESLRVAPHALDLAGALDASLTALTVHGGDKAAADGVLSRAADALTAGGHPPMSLAREGEPGEQIVALLDSGQADLVAMASHARSGPALWLHGSVADKVIRSTASPCLVVRMGDA